MVVIRKRREADGFRYELADFPAYVAELESRGIEPPSANYRIFVSYDDEQAIRQSVNDYDEQIARFFQLSPATDIECQIQDEV